MRTRIRYNHQTGEKYEIPDDYAEPSQEGFFMPDITEFVSPVSRELITSRSQLREHNKKNNVVQCGELKTAEEFNNRTGYRSVFHDEEKRFEGF